MKNILAAVAKVISSNSNPPSFWALFFIFMTAYLVSFSSGLALAAILLLIDNAIS